MELIIIYIVTIDCHLYIYIFMYCTIIFLTTVIHVQSVGLLDLK